MPAALDRVCSSPSQLVVINDCRSIGIPHICRRALSKDVARLPRSGGLQSAGAIFRSPFLVPQFQLLQRIPIRYRAEFVETPRGTPPAALDSMLKRDIECRTINACLPTRNYFQEFHCLGGLRPPRHLLFQDIQSPVGTMSARSTIKITVRSGARVRWRTPLGTTKP